MRLKLLTLLILLVLALTALSQGDAVTKPVENNTIRYPSEWALGIFVVLLVFFAAVPLLVNMIMAHRHLGKMTDALREFIGKNVNEIDADKLIQIIHECVSADPNGAAGTIRGTMALTITLIVGTSLFFLVSYPPKDPSTIKEVLLTLTGALTAVIGFYFGGKASETASIIQKAPEIKEKSPSEEPKAEVPKPKLYDIEENFTYGDKQYNKGEKMVDLSNIQVDILNGWVESKKVVPYVGDEKVERDKELKDRPGWYKINTDFHYQDDLYISGNIMNLTDVPASILAEWIKNKWVEPYKGPVA